MEVDTDLGLGFTGAAGFVAVAAIVGLGGLGLDLYGNWVVGCRIGGDMNSAYLHESRPAALTYVGSSAFWCALGFAFAPYSQ